jgi:TonB-dependent receptor
LVGLIVLMGISSLYAQFGTITGQVTDAETGERLPGANVIVKGTSFGDASGVDGRYAINRIPTGSYTLEISYLGYENQTSSVTVESNATQTANFSLQPAALEGEQVVVMGVRAAGQARALNQQMNAVNIKNVVASDQIGRFPDPSVPDALQRLPGVSIVRDQGEGRYITVRGGSASMTSVMINGENVPSPEGEERSIAMDAVPVDLLEAVEVSKAITPDLDADAIGGAVNLVTKRAPDNMIYSVEVGGGYNKIRNDPSGTVAGTFGDRFNDGKLGLLVSGTFSRRNFGSDNIEPAYDLGDPGLNDDVLEGMELRHYTIWRGRVGATGMFDYRLNPNSSLYLSGFYSELQDEEQRRALELNVADNEVVFGHKNRREDQATFNLTGGGDHLLKSGMKLDYHATYTYSDQDRAYDQLLNFALDGDAAPIAFDPDISDPDNIQPNPQGNFISSGTYLFDNVENEVSSSKNTDFVTAANLTIPYQLGGQAAAKLKFGAKVRFKNKDQQVSVDEFSLLNGDIVLGQDIGSFGIDLDGFNPGTYPYPSPVTSEDENADFLTNNSANLEQEHVTIEDSQDYDIEETTYAGYVMSEINVTPKFMFLPGVRVEHTKVKADGFLVDGDAVSPTRNEKDYTKFFPMVHARYRITSLTNLRAAFTTAISRPNFFDLVPYETIDDEEITRGNTALDPATSWNLDLILEHYDRYIGVMTAGVFYKKVQDPIFFFFEEQDIAGTTFEVTQPRNGDSGNIFGFELAAQQQLKFLPKPLDGFGIYANYTFTDSDANVPFEGAIRSTTFPGQADHVLNAALSYEKGRFSSQVSANFQDAFILEIGESAEQDLFVAKHLQFDLSASYRFTSALALFLEVVNLTNEPYEVFQGDEARPIQREFYETWGRVGFRFNR